METILSVRNLKKHFPVKKGLFSRSREVVKAVDGLSFDLRRGETLSLVGESGCGKSTVARLILRLIEPTEGRVIFQGQDITAFSRREMRPLRPSLQIIFQDPFSSLNPRLTVKDIIGEGLRRHENLDDQSLRERVMGIMEKVGLRPEHYNRHPHEFSGGQRQRIGVARSIVLNPRLIVADEPLSALDVSIQAQVLNLLERLKGDLGLSYLFISHDLSVVEHISDRIAVMYLGRIVELAPKRELYARPFHPYTQALFSAAPLPVVGRRKDRIILVGDIPSPLDPPPGCRFHTRCRHRQDICSQKTPPLEELEPGRFAACHFPLDRNQD